MYKYCIVIIENYKNTIDKLYRDLVVLTKYRPHWPLEFRNVKVHVGVWKIKHLIRWIIFNIYMIFSDDLIQNSVVFLQQKKKSISIQNQQTDGTTQARNRRKCLFEIWIFALSKEKYILTLTLTITQYI